MAFRIIEGVPGSGKSYYIVNWLALESGFCLELKDGGYVLDPSKRVRVLTNVAGLKVTHEDFQTALDEAGGFQTFFTLEYQQYFSRGFHIVYILDEAQEWFHPRFGEKLTKETLRYFTWARHEGHDLFLLTQNVRLLMQEVCFLPEYIVQAQPRSNNVSKELTYKYRTLDGGEIRLHRLFFSKKVADLYKSAEKGETIKIKNYRARKVLAAFALSLVLIVFGFRGIYNRWGSFFGSKPETAAAPASAAAAPVSASPSASAPASVPAASSGSSGLPLGSAPSSSPAPEYYMYRLDHAVYPGGVRLLFGITWMPLQQFPYPLVKKGRVYFAMIPAVLLPALESGSRALPVRTKTPDRG
jgi:zona occludens toxin (predicted ATPase)